MINEGNPSCYEFYSGQKRNMFVFWHLCNRHSSRYIGYLERIIFYLKMFRGGFIEINGRVYTEHYFAHNSAPFDAWCLIAMCVTMGRCGILFLPFHDCRQEVVNACAVTKFHYSVYINLDLKDVGCSVEWIHQFHDKVQ